MPAVLALRQARPDARPGIERLFPMGADDFFAAERLRPDPVVSLEPAFSVVVVTAARALWRMSAAPRPHSGRATHC